MESAAPAAQPWRWVRVCECQVRAGTAASGRDCTARAGSRRTRGETDLHQVRPQLKVQGRGARRQAPHAACCLQDRGGPTGVGVQVKGSTWARQHRHRTLRKRPGVHRAAARGSEKRLEGRPGPDVEDLSLEDRLHLGGPGECLQGNVTGVGWVGGGGKSELERPQGGGCCHGQSGQRQEVRGPGEGGARMPPWLFCCKLRECCVLYLKKNGPREGMVCKKLVFPEDIHSPDRPLRVLRVGPNQGGHVQA